MKRAEAGGQKRHMASQRMHSRLGRDASHRDGAHSAVAFEQDLRNNLSMWNRLNRLGRASPRLDTIASYSLTIRLHRLTTPKTPNRRRGETGRKD